MLDIIDRYIIKLFLMYFLGSMIVLVTLFLAIDALTLFTDYKASIDKIALYYLYTLPGIVNQMLPAVCMISTLFTLGELNKNSELIALFSLGSSLARISAPILVIVATMSIIAFWMGDRILPYTNKKKNYTWYVEIRNKPERYMTLKNERIWYRQKNVLFNIKQLEPIEKRAQGLSFYYFDDSWNLVQTITAREANIEENGWELKDGSVTLFTDESSFPLNQSFETKKIEIEQDVTAIQEETKRITEMLSIKEIRKYIQKNKEAGLNTLRFEVDLQAKFGYALASFILAFISIPFSVTNNRAGGRVIGITICIGLAFGYWALLNLGLTMGRHGYLPPILSAWLPNLFMIGLVSFLILRLKK